MHIENLIKTFNTDNPPFGFDIGGKPATLKFKHQRPIRRQENRRDYIFTVEEAPLTIVVEVETHEERNYLTFSIRLIAESDVKDNISNVRILDAKGLEADTLRGWEGGYAPDFDEEGRKWRTIPTPPLLYKMWDKPLADEPIEYIDLSGRSSCNLFPVWFVYNDNGGLWVGPEWSGSWNMQTGKNADGAWFQFGLPVLDLQMLQNEEIQLPPLSMGCYEGEIGDGCVNLRRIIQSDFMPNIGDEELTLPHVSAHFIGGSIPDCDTPGNEKAMNLAAAMGMEHYIYASCWYRPPTGTKTPFTLEEIKEMHPNTESVEGYEENAWWEQCGHYEPFQDRFPGGSIQAFSDMLKERGMTLGLWYDPRINVFTDEHKITNDFLTPYHHDQPSDKAWDLGLIDMGRRSGRDFMYELMERFVVEFGAGYLWHDLNVPTRYRYWQETEEEGRKGLKELFHYNGMDEVYDRFRENYPHIWIKWCGSGGSMLNLGILRRVHCFRMADFGGVKDEGENQNVDAARDMRTCANWIIPTRYLINIRGLPKADNPDESRLHLLLDLFGSTFSVHHSFRGWSDRDRADATGLAGIYKNVRKYLMGDYWSLFPLSEDQTGWDGWQFHDPVTSTGILLFFKRRDENSDTQTVQLRWPDDIENLSFCNLAGEAKIEVSGKDFKVTMTDRAALLRYDRP